MYKDVKTVNPLGGQCGHKCLYCSTISLSKIYPGVRNKYQGEYKLYESELKKSWGKNNQIFVCAQNDLFEAGVPGDFIEAILEKARNSDKSNLFMFQTKNPARMVHYLGKFPDNCMLGTTIETNREDLIKEWSDAPTIKSRAEAIKYIGNYGFLTYITIEPIMDFDPSALSLLIENIGPDKIFIGADSKKNGMPEPSARDIKLLIADFEWVGVEIEEKTNLARLKGAEA